MALTLLVLAVNTQIGGEAVETYVNEQLSRQQRKALKAMQLPEQPLIALGVFYVKACRS